MRKLKSATSFAEVIVVVLFIGILSAVAIPRWSCSVSKKTKAETISKKIVTEFRLNRRLSISDVVNNPSGYKMVFFSNYYHIKSRDTDEIIVENQIDPAISVTGAANFRFTPLGNLEPDDGTSVTVSSSDRSFTISIVPSTGMVTCTEN